MAKTRATAIGHHNGSSTQPVTRLGHSSAEGKAATWHTFATVIMNKDGSGRVQVARDNHIFLAVDWNPETEPEPTTTDHTAIERARKRRLEDGIPQLAKDGS